MDPAELEFLAENDAIEVVPNFTHAQMHLIQVFSRMRRCTLYMYFHACVDAHYTGISTHAQMHLIQVFSRMRSRFLVWIDGFLILWH